MRLCKKNYQSNHSVQNLKIWKTRRCASCKTEKHQWLTDWLTDNLKSRDASASKKIVRDYLLVVFDCSLNQTWHLLKNLHPWIFRPKISHTLFSLNINTLGDKKTPKNEGIWKNLHRWQKFYTATGSDGIDKSHLWFKLCKFLFAMFRIIILIKGQFGLWPGIYICSKVVH